MAVVCAGALALAAPVAAQARTKSVSMGPSPTAAKAFQKSARTSTTSSPTG